MRFPLRERKPIHYFFGEKTWYSNFHLGQDYAAAEGEALFAPTDGEILWQTFGKEGGNMIGFKDNQGMIWRFLHLKGFNGKPRKVKEGEIIGFCDNTGLSKGTHLHIDIWKGKIDLNNKKLLIDPEKYIKEGDEMNLKDIFKGCKTGKFPNSPTVYVGIPNWQTLEQINGGRIDEVWFEGMEVIAFKGKPERYIHIKDPEMWNRLNGGKLDREFDDPEVLSKQVSEQALRIQELQNDKNQLEKIIQEQKNQINNLESYLARLENEVETKVELVDSLSKETAMQEERIRQFAKSWAEKLVEFLKRLFKREKW